MKVERYLSVVSLLFGDAVMYSPCIRDLAQRFDLKLICGEYNRDLWVWLQKEVEGMDYEIVGWIEENTDGRKPDGYVSPLTPAWGWPAMVAGEAEAKRHYPHDAYLSLTQPLSVEENIWSAYGLEKLPGLKLRRLSIQDGSHIAVHRYTHHEWKNVQALENYQGSPYYPLYELGYRLNGNIPDKNRPPFTEQAERALTAYAVIGQLSGWSCFAAVFGKKQIICSFTADQNLNFSRFNPRCRFLVQPDHATFARVLEEEGC